MGYHGRAGVASSRDARYSRPGCRGADFGTTRHGRIRDGVAILLLAASPLFGATINGADGLTVTVEDNGSYSISAPFLRWNFGGSVGAWVSNIAARSGVDGAGPYNEISFGLWSDSSRRAAIRAYSNHHAVVFSVAYSHATANTWSFPNLAQYPKNLDHLVYSGAFAPPVFGGSAPESPWIFFDSARNTFILSPAKHFMVASTKWGPNGEIASGISPRIAVLPPGFEYETLLVLEPGINRAFDTWGQTLTGLKGKKRAPNDADIMLKQIGYWTDNGAAYYYQAAPGLSYEQTLASVRADFDRAGIQLGYIQLDSWFYPKGPGSAWTDGADGIFEYVADPTLFPEGLAAFQRFLNVPLVTHARWIDASSPYHGVYQMSGNVVVDPNYWNATAAYLASAGVATYEQDWLDDAAHADFNLTDPEAFLDNMAAGMGQHGVTLQYCMASTRHFLQASKYSNLTTARTSLDRFERSHWTHFLYTSRLASALGIWPFTDVLMSRETDNLLLATLSAGPVGIGDAIGALDTGNLLGAARRDGVIVKPDAPLTPIDASFLNAAAGADAPQIAATSSDFGNLRTSYVVAYPVGSNRDATFNLADLGMDRPAYLYDYFSKAGQVVQPSDQVALPIQDSLLYLIAAPIGPSGIAVVGDEGQFATMGKKRIAEMSDNGTARLTLTFAPGEDSRTLLGYSPSQPLVCAQSGAIAHFTYDAESRQFEIAIQPRDGTASISIARRNMPFQRRRVDSACTSGSSVVHRDPRKPVHTPQPH